MQQMVLGQPTLNVYGNQVHLEIVTAEHTLVVNCYTYGNKRPKWTPQAKIGDFNVKCTTDGRKYVDFSSERGTNTRTGETEKSTNADARTFKPKMYAQCDCLKLLLTDVHQKHAQLTHHST